MDGQIKFQMQCLENRTVSIIRNLKIGHIKCRYQNNSDMKYELNHPSEGALEVYDRNCQVIDKSIKRTIKVKIGNKIITIIDLYSFENPEATPILQNHNIYGEQITKTHHYNQESVRNSQRMLQQDRMPSQQLEISQETIQRSSKKNTQQKIHSVRNVNKNILKAFYKYWIAQGNDEQKQYAHKMILKNNFTHKAFQAILLNRQAIKMLQVFLQQQFETWLVMSRTQQKQAYRQRCSKILNMIRKIQKK